MRGGRGVAGRTVGLLGAIFTYAVRQGLRTDNPAHGIVKFAEQHRERRLTDDEYRQLGKSLSMAHQDDVWKPAIEATWLMILTGWRRGEVLSLRWSEVDLSRRTARLADTKTGASLRPLSELASTVIQSQPRIGDLVFPSRSGEAAIVGYRTMWLRIAKLGDLPADITPHVLRHSFASLAADLGYNEATIASLLGHLELERLAGAGVDERQAVREVLDQLELADRSHARGDLHRSDRAPGRVDDEQAGLTGERRRDHLGVVSPLDPADVGRNRRHVPSLAPAPGRSHGSEHRDSPVLDTELAQAAGSSDSGSPGAASAGRSRSPKAATRTPIRRTGRGGA